MLNVYCVHFWEGSDSEVFVCRICVRTWDKSKSAHPPKVIIGEVSLPDVPFFQTLENE